jgi:hypothetical protein
MKLRGSFVKNNESTIKQQPGNGNAFRHAQKLKKINNLFTFVCLSPERSH